MSVGAWPWAQILLTGFSLGSFYALVALGFSLIFGVTRAFNLAHGELIVVAGYLSFALWKFYQVPFLLTFWPCLLAMALAALPLCLLLRGLKEPYALNTLVVTFGLALLLQNLMLVFFSADYRLIRPESVHFIVPGTDLAISLNQVSLVLLSLLATGAVHVLLHHTFLGKALRATIQDPEAAQVAGINVKRMTFAAFGLGRAADRPGRTALWAKHVPVPHGRHRGDVNRHYFDNLCRGRPHPYPAAGRLAPGTGRVGHHHDFGQQVAGNGGGSGPPGSAGLQAGGDCRPPAGVALMPRALGRGHHGFHRLKGLGRRPLTHPPTA